MNLGIALLFSGLWCMGVALVIDQPGPVDDLSVALLLFLLLPISLMWSAVMQGEDGP